MHSLIVSIVEMPGMHQLLTCFSGDHIRSHWWRVRFGGSHSSRHSPSDDVPPVIAYPRKKCLIDIRYGPKAFTATAGTKCIICRVR